MISEFGLLHILKNLLHQKRLNFKEYLDAIRYQRICNIGYVAYIALWSPIISRKDVYYKTN